jgi:hypothetical protein
VSFSISSISCQWALAACLSGLALTAAAAQPQDTVVAFARLGVNAMPAFRVTDIDDATLSDLGVYISKTQPPAAAKK